MIDGKLEQFLNDLTELSKKYGFSIGGCGCCGSPWIFDEESRKIVVEDLYYEHDKYTGERYDTN